MLTESAPESTASLSPGTIRHLALADGYALLALLLQFPTAALVQGIESGALGSDFQAVAHELAISPAALKSAEELHRACLQSTSEDPFALATIRREHTRLFDHPDRPAIPFYEGLFLDSERLRNGKESSGARLFVNPAALDAERCYRRVQVRPAGDIRLPADCITTELEFLQHLHLSLARSLIENDKETVALLDDALREFTAIHVERWFAPFFGRCAAESNHELYRLTGAIGTLIASVSNPSASACPPAKMT